MKKKFHEEIINSFKSKEYWFGLAVIVVSCLITAVNNLSENGIFGDLKIGGSEFFMASSCIATFC